MTTLHMGRLYEQATSARRRTRSTDPATSLLAVAGAVKSGLRSPLAVYTLMLDDGARTDEAICREVRSAGFMRTADTIRHGRKVLSQAGILKLMEQAGKTITGAKAQVWRLARRDDELDRLLEEEVA